MTKPIRFERVYACKVNGTCKIKAHSLWALCIERKKQLFAALKFLKLDKTFARYNANGSQLQANPCHLLYIQHCKNSPLLCSHNNDVCTKCL